MGLLSKANLFENTKPEGLAFSNFIINNNIKQFALFEKINNQFIITNSLGFDYKSIISSESTIDFWNGAVNNSDLNTFKQFFSPELSEKIRTVKIFQISQDKIFMLCNQELSEKIKSELSNISIATTFTSENFDSSKASESFEISLLEQNNFSTSILNELFNQLILLNKDLKIEITESKIKFSVTNNNLPSQLYINHLYLNLSYFSDDCKKLFLIK